MSSEDSFTDETSFNEVHLNLTPLGACLQLFNFAILQK